MHKIISSFFIIFILFSLIGCGGQSNHPASSQTGSIRVMIKWPNSIQAKTILPETQSIKISVTDYYAARNVIKEIIINNPDTNAIIQDIPGETAVYVQARAYTEANGSGEIISFGESGLINVVPNQTNDAAISLKRNVVFYLNLEYYANPNIYEIKCNLSKYCYGPNENTNLNNATITVAGYQIPLIADGLFWHSPISLIPGDKVTVDIAHPSFGEYQATLTVPETLPSITTIPDDLNQWVNGSVEDVIVSWPQVVCDQYYVALELFDENKSARVERDRLVTNTTTTFEEYDLGFADQLASYVDIRVSAIGYAEIPDFYNSSLLIWPQTLARKTNLP